MGEAVLKKLVFFGPFRPQFGLKIRGEGPSLDPPLRQLTACTACSTFFGSVLLSMPRLNLSPLVLTNFFFSVFFFLFTHFCFNFHISVFFLMLLYYSLVNFSLWQSIFDSSSFTIINFCMYCCKTTIGDKMS